jgi:O-6-methylguanine DNA methyltransferase
MTDNVTLSRSWLKTPIGDMLALASDEGLCALEFDANRRHVRLEARLRRWFRSHEIVDRKTWVLSDTERWLAGYFNGLSADAGSIPLDMRGAPFEHRVWRALLTIPAGETSTYGAIARVIESPDASRAVGAANGANPVSIIVPCHRVIGSDGSLTGYGGGIGRKKWLLDHERRWKADVLF